MSEILFQYHKVNPTTWVYLSSLLMIGLYFKFGRFWSVRNLDLVLLILLAPGFLLAQYGGESRVRATRLIVLELREKARNETAAATAPPVRESTTEVNEMEPVPGAATANGDSSAGIAAEAASSVAQSSVADVVASPPGSPAALEAAQIESKSAVVTPTPAQKQLAHARKIEYLGFLWLFSVGVFLLIRLFLDPTMVRRPLLEPNLSAGGLMFIGCSLFVFLMANVIANKPPDDREIDTVTMEALASGTIDVAASGQPIQRGPGYALLNRIPSIPTMPLVPEGVMSRRPFDASYANVAKLIAILCHLAVVLGVVAIGYWHFGYFRTGVGVATLYLMLPYTAQTTGQIDHVIPAALLIWAVLCYRRPLSAGMLLGLATSLVYYPLFLLPLWVSFYWRRGLGRFTGGVMIVMVVMAVALLFMRDASYWENLKQMFGLWLPKQQGLEGIWGLGWNPVYRIPVLAAFLALSGTLAMWPAQKNLGTLLSCSAAVMVATQFWHGFGGGLYMAWYLPLTLLAIFRPNLEDRVAVVVLGQGWRARRVSDVSDGFKAA